ncbi:chromosome partitioning protein ParB, partial [Salmonella enterica]|nr:chromosome partitioning protein ParB [Salmonella enterica]
MQMNKLTAGRPSATKSKLSVADVSEQERIKWISFDMTEANHRELKKYAAEQGVT